MSLNKYSCFFGGLVELNAKPFLEEEFDDVEWSSDKDWQSPFDFKCKDGNDIYYIDVKSCLNKVIYMSKKKFELLKTGWLNPFYFMLYRGNGYELIDFNSLITNSDYRISFIRYNRNRSNYYKEHRKRMKEETGVSHCLECESSQIYITQKVIVCRRCGHKEERF